jgi:hypothetical protein
MLSPRPVWTNADNWTRRYDGTVCGEGCWMCLEQAEIEGLTVPYWGA